MRSNRGFAVLVTGGFAAGVVIGLTLARGSATTTAPIENLAAGVAAAGDAPAATARASSRTAPRTQSSLPRPAEPLPPADAPVAEVFDELAARARAGEAAAARRIADDLLRCGQVDSAMFDAKALLDFDAANTRGTSAEHNEYLLQRTDELLRQHREHKERCAGVDTLEGSASEWIEQAARNGDPAAMLCYALFPNDWNADVPSPAWLRHAEQAYAQSPQLVRRAFDTGMPEAAAVLSQMYRAPEPMGGRWQGRLGADPYWAYAYALVAADTLPGRRREFWGKQSEKLALPLSSELRARARGWADERRSRMTLPPLPDPDAGPRPNPDCALLTYMATRL
jgi:hypothetical protein